MKIQNYKFIKPRPKGYLKDAACIIKMIVFSLLAYPLFYYPCFQYLRLVLVCSRTTWMLGWGKEEGKYVSRYDS